MRRYILPIAAILLTTAACGSGKPVPTVDGNVPTGKQAASPSASSSASAPKTPAPAQTLPAGSWCANTTHAGDDVCKWNPSESRFPTLPSGSEWDSYMSSGMGDVWKQLCEEKNPASACEATPSR
ncbi:hypothetical protein [Streptomyces sp. MUSC 14]|uniref:hypothetical protein n=1 Tax=Streptomyces sp. MUSC 14 TaxID=1354889 RepID=UPI0008F5C6FF|nr:hypothetical protein [Streptomyces sp. MUSC 14]